MAQIGSDLSFGTTTAVAVRPEAALTGVHGADKLKIGRKGEVSADAAYVHQMFFQRLSQNFKRRRMVLRELV